MAATSIFFNGRLIRTPGGYSVVDASGLAQVGLGASGIVAVLGTAEGGKPMNEITEPGDLLRMSKPEKARELFHSGQLLEVSDMLFDPSNDPDILGGAQEVIACKVNPATQSAATLTNAYGDSLDLTSVDYGAFTEQVNIDISPGTDSGKLVTITFEDNVETVDNLGDDVMFSLTYNDSGTGWDTMTAEVEAGGAIVAKGTRDEAGLDSEITAQPSAASTLNVASSDAGDVGQTLIIYGTDAAGTAFAMETLTLNGTTTVNGSTTFTKVLGARIIGTIAGTVTIEDDDPATIVTLAAAANPTAGLVSCDDMYVAKDTLDIVADGASSQHVGLIGLSKTGAAQQELLQLNGTTTVNGTAEWSEIEWIAMGDVDAAGPTTVTLSAEAGRTDPSTQDTLRKCSDYFNARSRTPAATTYGFTFTLVTGMTSFDPDDLDNTTDAGGAVSCLSPTTPDFYANLWTIIDWITNNSQYISAAAATGAAGGFPSDTAAPVFLSGGGEGTTTFSEWQSALNMLKQVRVNTVVVLTADPAVHAALESHLSYMCGIGRSERDGVVGLLNTAMTDLPTKSEIKSQIVDLNSRHIRAVAQSIERYNTQGERQEFDPPYLAAVIAGMQAGSSVGTSLTWKYVDVLSVRQASAVGAWNPTDDSEEMISAGLCFLEEVDGVGRRVVRNITTHLSTDNIAYTEASVNEAVNYAVFNFRTNLEVAVGKKGFAGTINAAKGIAVNILGLQIDEQILVAWRALNLELVVDVLEVSVQMAPVIPINFVLTTVHLVTIQQRAS